MVFNVAAHNRDDHVKNFAFLIDETGEWTQAAEAGVRVATIGEISQAHRRVALVTAKRSSTGGRK